MIVTEFKVKAKPNQLAGIDDAIRTGQFIRNKALRFWMDADKTQKIGRFDLNGHCKFLAAEFPFAGELNAMARQAHAERAWAAISRFYENCKKGVKPVGYPKFKKNSRSVEYKTSGWKILGSKRIKFTDGKNIGVLKLIGSHDLQYYPKELIKRVRLIRRADGYYCQFCVNVERSEPLDPTGQSIGLDVGLNHFYTDSNGATVDNPRFYRKREAKRRKLARRFSRKKKRSNNRKKARNRLARFDLKTSRMRKDHAVKLARCVVQSNDLIAYEDLRIRNMMKNHCLAKSIGDAGWYQFRMWIERFGRIFNRVTVAVPPAYTSQKCFSCGATVKKSLSTRTHICGCGCELDRDHNAALNILNMAINKRTAGHVGTEKGNLLKASGEINLCMGLDSNPSVS